MFIKSFENLLKTDIAIAGCKGASLGEMTQAGIAVPPGYVVLAPVFDKFLDEADLHWKIRNELNNIIQDEMLTIEHASERIQTIILSAEISKNVEDEILKAFKILGATHVAVRSSATLEDSDSSAWAGQLDSFLGVTEDVLVENIKRCWASLFTPRAIFYRFEEGFKDSNVSVAVVVQKMINSEKSGVAFSVHPVTEDPNQLIIEAGFGLGEAVVSGSITPDRYIVSKKDWQIVDTKIAEQTRKIICKECGGNEWVDIEKKEGGKQVVTNDEILELSKLVVKIEKHYDFPCDIEWVVEDNVLYIVQSRPITTLGNTKNKMEVRDEYHKVMTRSISLLDCEMWDKVERIELPNMYDNCVAYDPVFVYTPQKATAVYYNFSDPHQDTLPLINYFNKKEESFDNLRKEFDKDCEIVWKLAKSDNEEDFTALFESIIKVWPLITISMSLGNRDKQYSSVKPALVTKCRKLRLENEDILHTPVEVLFKRAVQKVSKEHKEWAEFLTYEEIKSETAPSFEELKKRSRGYVYHKGVLHSGEELADYADRNNFIVIEELVSINDTPKNSVNGDVTYAGKVVGRVKIIFEEGDINKVKEGDVLVTPMTTPNLVPAMKKASAFVTDEGGITCHASIVSREFQKPCIIGTKIATQIFKDGDIVEVDADNGIVRILKKK